MTIKPNLTTAEQREAAHEAAAVQAASYAHPEGGPAPDAIPAPADALTRRAIRPALMRGGPMDHRSKRTTVYFAVPCAPCLHFDRGTFTTLARIGGSMRQVRAVFPAASPDGPLNMKISRYLYTGTMLDGTLLYDFAGMVDPLSGCAPPAGEEPPRMSAAEEDLREYAHYYAAGGDPEKALACAKAAFDIALYLP